MRVLFDTNVILDLLLDREPYSKHAALLISMVDRSELVGLLCANSITTIHYILMKGINKIDAKKHLKKLIDIFEIAPVNRGVIERAFYLKFDDFEDAIVHEAAVLSNADCIVTRNVKDFKGAALPVLEPKELLITLKIKKGLDE